MTETTIMNRIQTTISTDGVLISFTLHIIMTKDKDTHTYYNLGGFFTSYDFYVVFYVLL